MKIEVSVGEVVDKISILNIKLNKITNKLKLEHIQKEYDILTNTLTKHGIVCDELSNELERINLVIWEAEEIIRTAEVGSESFCKCARTIHSFNDKRYVVKNKINERHNSEILEQKSYEGI